MSADTTSNLVKIAIVGMTGSGKTVLVTTLAMKMAQMSLEGVFLAPSGPKRRETLRYTQSNWQTLNSGQWPPSTPAGELIELQWELNTKNCQASVQFLDCAGQDIRSLFNDENFNPDSLGEDLKRVFDSVNSANVLILLVNMKDLLATSDSTAEILDLDQMIHTLQQRSDIPRRIAVAFSQYDKYKPEVDQKFNGDFLEYVRGYLPYLYGQYKRSHNFELIPVAAVNDTQKVVENGEVKQYPVPFFSSYNLETLIHWMADSVEQLTEEKKRKKEEERQRHETAKQKKQKSLFKIAVSAMIIVFMFIAGFLYCNIPSKPKINQDIKHKAGERLVKEINGVEFAFRFCPSGSFTMGSPIWEKYHDQYEKLHRVTLTQSFWMLETEVTQKQWQAIMGNNPSEFKDDNRPVENITWDECQEFCQKCTELGLPVKLPTEAQWEYACRAGTTGTFAGNLESMAWYDSNSFGKTHPVGMKEPNPWGLYDMHGNVRERCQDWNTFDCYSIWSVTDPTGPYDGHDRVDRGGSWECEARFCRSADRLSYPPDERTNFLGFRVLTPASSLDN